MPKISSRLDDLRQSGRAPVEVDSRLPEIVRTESELEVEADLRNVMAQQRLGVTTRRPPPVVASPQSGLGSTTPDWLRMPRAGPAIVSEQVCRVDRPDAYLWRDARRTSCSGRDLHSRRRAYAEPARSS